MDSKLRPKPRPAFAMPADGFNDIAMCRCGPLLFNRHDRYIGASLRKYGEWSPGDLDLLRQVVVAGSTVVEIGANIGAHTVELSRLVGPKGQVLAFEPQRIVFQTLCANLALNSCANVHALQVAVGAAPGEISVPFLPPDRPANFGGVSLQGVASGERITLRTIDQFALPACHLLKLDVEGMEVEALQGASRTVATHRPVLYFEDDRKERHDEVVSLVLSWGYKLYQHNTPLYSSANYAGDAENVFGNIVSMNVLGLPAERKVTVNDLREIS